VNDKPSWAKFDALFLGPIPKSWINETDEPVAIEEPKCESASALALRRWFKQAPEADTDD
jgi:hypothetical protein